MSADAITIYTKMAVCVNESLLLLVILKERKKIMKAFTKILIVFKREALMAARDE